jgi:hypothetical protein
MHPQLSDEERGLPKPQPQRPVVSNPSTPGVQKPPNRPGGRDAPPAHETRKASSDRIIEVSEYDPAWTDLPEAEFAAVMADVKPAFDRHLRRQRDRRIQPRAQRPDRVQRGSTRQARPARRRRASARSPGRLADDPDPGPEHLVRPRLTAQERRWLKSEVDRLRRIQVEHLARRDLALFADDPGGVTA